jgi:transposase
MLKHRVLPVSLLYPHLGEAYRLKEMFLDVFDIHEAEQAKGYLKFWCDLVIESAIQPFIKFVNLIKTHWWGIVNYFDSKLTNEMSMSFKTHQP